MEIVLSERGLGTKNRESADQIYARFVVMADITAIGPQVVKFNKVSRDHRILFRHNVYGNNYAQLF